MRKFNFFIFAMLASALFSQNVFSAEMAMNCLSNDKYLQLKFEFSDQKYRGSGYTHLTSVGWRSSFYSFASLVCNVDAVHFEYGSTLKCIGHFYAGIIQFSGKINQNGGQMNVNILNDSSIFAEEVEGLVLKCDPIQKKSIDTLNN